MYYSAFAEEGGGGQGVNFGTRRCGWEGHGARYHPPTSRVSTGAGTPPLPPAETHSRIPTPGILASHYQLFISLLVASLADSSEKSAPKLSPLQGLG